MEYLSLILFVVVCLVLLLGYPVAFTLAGASLAFAGLGVMLNVFDWSFVQAMPNRLFGIMNNQTLLAVPLFVFMGMVLQKSQVAESLLTAMSSLFGKNKGGMAVSVVLVGMLLAASTGIVGATVVTMGVLSLPVMLKNGYSPALATGSICATGTLGQIIPPSIALVLLGDVLSSAYQQAQLEMGIFSPDSVSVGDLFMGAIVPGLVLVLAYLVYVLVHTRHMDKELTDDTLATQDNTQNANLWTALLPPLSLIFVVLGSILMGYATPTEAAGVGAAGALIITLAKRRLTLPLLKEVMENTTKVTSMIFLILIGASLFSLVFRGFGGEELLNHFFSSLPGGSVTALIFVMLIIFALGFVLDFIEITFVVVPIVAPILLAMGIDPVWLGILIALNLQTSFLTPPFGFSLFYLRGVAPASVKTEEIYRGVVPFIIIQLCVLVLVACLPELATWLPEQVYG